MNILSVYKNVKDVISIHPSVFFLLFYLMFLYIHRETYHHAVWARHENAPVLPVPLGLGPVDSVPSVGNDDFRTFNRQLSVHVQYGAFHTCGKKSRKKNILRENHLLQYSPILHWVGPLVPFLTNGFPAKFAIAFAINACFSPSIRIVRKNHFNNFLSIGK